MIQIELDEDDGFCVVEGLDEFLQKMEKSGTVEVIGIWDGRSYYIHEVGEQVCVLNQSAQNALVKLAEALILEISSKRLH